MKKIIVALIVLVILVTGCGIEPTQRTDQGFHIAQQRDDNVYTVVIEMEDMNSYSEIRGQMSGGGYMGGGSGMASVSGSVWQEGKGLVRAILISTSPEIEFANIGDIIIVKTTDRKATMGIPGDLLTLYCTVDFEPVCARDMEGNAYCRDLWEFDYCRLVEIEH